MSDRRHRARDVRRDADRSDDDAFRYEPADDLERALQTGVLAFPEDLEGPREAPQPARPASAPAGRDRTARDALARAAAFEPEGDDAEPFRWQPPGRRPDGEAAPQAGADETAPVPREPPSEAAAAEEIAGSDAPAPAGEPSQAHDEPTLFDLEAMDGEASPQRAGESVATTEPPETAGLRPVAIDAVDPAPEASNPEPSAVDPEPTADDDDFDPVEHALLMALGHADDDAADDGGVRDTAGSGQPDPAMAAAAATPPADEATDPVPGTGSDLAHGIDDDDRRAPLITRDVAPPPVPAAASVGATTDEVCAPDLRAVADESAEARPDDRPATESHEAEDPGRAARDAFAEALMAELEGRPREIEPAPPPPAAERDDPLSPGVSTEEVAAQPSIEPDAATGQRTGEGDPGGDSEPGDGTPTETAPRDDIVTASPARPVHPWLRRPATAASRERGKADEEVDLDAAIGAVVASRSAAPQPADSDAIAPNDQATGWQDEAASPTSFFRRGRPESLLRAPAADRPDVGGRGTADSAAARSGAPSAPAIGPKPSRLPGQRARREVIPEFHFDRSPDAAATEGEPAPHRGDTDDPLGGPRFGEPLDWSGARAGRSQRGAALPAVVSAGDIEVGREPSDDHRAEQEEWDLGAEIAAVASAGFGAGRRDHDDIVDLDEDDLADTFAGDGKERGRERGRPLRRSTVIGGGVVALALLGAVGIVGYGALDGGTSAEPPIIHADADGFKTFPDPSEADETDLAFDGEIEDPEGEDARLIVAETPEIDDEPVSALRDETEDILRSRLVRTVVVRPDGTIVREGDETTGDTATTAAGAAPAGAGTDTAAARWPAEPELDDPVANLLQAQQSADETDSDTSPFDRARENAGAGSGETGFGTTTAPDAEPADSADAEETLVASTLAPDDLAIGVPTPRRRPPAPPRRSTIAPPADASFGTGGSRSVAFDGVASETEAAPTVVASNGAAGIAYPGETPSSIIPEPQLAPEPEQQAPAASSGSSRQPQTGLVRPRNNAFIDRALGLKNNPEPPKRRLANPGPVSPNASRVTAELLPWSVQIASQRSASDAQRTYEAMQARFPNIIGNRPPVIRKVDIAGRGTFYRVRIPTGSREEARNLCAQLKAAGGDCFVGPSDSS